MNRIHLLKIILVFLSVSFLAPTTIWADSEEVAALASGTKNMQSYVPRPGSSH
jgi:hypothetical protein